MLKRLFDLLVALLGVIILSPLLLVISVWIRLDSPGPVLYRGQRVGRFGRPFRMFKFRTMVVDADRIGGSSSGDDDPRITRVGRFLRKFKLDELPQLFNILRGEMSLVGPRPEVQKFTDMFTEEERAILSVRPGITDWASLWNSDEGAILAGSSDPDQTYLELIRPTKLRLQLKYVRNHSFWIDLRILWFTVWRIFSRDRVPHELRAESEPVPVEETAGLQATGEGTRSGSLEVDKRTGAARVALIAWYTFAIIMPLGNTSLATLLFLAAAIGAVRSSEGRQRLAHHWRSYPFLPILAVFVAALYLSALLAQERQLALLCATGYTLITASPLLASAAWGVPSLRWMARRGIPLMTGSALVSCAAVLYQIYALNIWKPMAVFVGTQGSVGLLLMVMSLTFGLMTVPGLRRNRRIMLLAAWVVMLWTLVASEVRAAWFGLVFVVVGHIWRLGWTAILAAGVLAVAGGFLMLVTGRTSLLGRLASVLKVSSYMDRWWIWQAAIAMFQDHPLLGIGPGTFVRMFDEYRPPQLLEMGLTQSFSFAHNIVLGVLSEVGLIGFVAFAALIGTAFLAARDWGRRKQDASDRAIVYALVLAIGGMIVREMADNTIFHLEIGGAFWATVIYLGCATATRSEMQGSSDASRGPSSILQERRG